MKKIKKHLNSILIKPAGPDCNMACHYCFYLEKAELFRENNIHRMSEEILEKVVRQMLSQNLKHVSFGWQGGEPTLMGLPFFEKAVELQKRYGMNKMVGNGFQTNGILIDQDWTKFFAQYKFLVGLSLDGPEHIHNHYRLSAGGTGTWQKVVDSAKMMLDGGVEVNALTVVNDYSVQFPEEIYGFHKEMGLNFMQFIPCVERDPIDSSKAAPFSVGAEEFGTFLCTLFDLWINDFVDGTPLTSIRYFDSLFYAYVDMVPPECTLLPECGVYVVVEHNGDVFACDFFVEPEWKLGNIANQSLLDMLNSPRQKEFGLMKAELHQDCQACKWLKYCWGGCTKDRLKDFGDKGLSHFCLSYKMLLSHADDKFKALAAEWKRKQQNEAERHRQEILAGIRRGEIKVRRNDPCPCGSGIKFKKCCGVDL